MGGGPRLGTPHRLVLAQGTVQHNESSKMYEYIRSGLPVVSEQPVPNNWLIHESGLGSVAEFMDDANATELLEQAVEFEWDRTAAIEYMLENHTWDRRVSAYDVIIKERLCEV